MKLESRDARIALLVGAAAAAAVGFLSFGLFPSDLQFHKYPVAGARYVNGLLTAERVLDFSPLYLALHVAAARLGGAVQGILLLQVAAVATSASLLYLLLRRHGGVSLALAGVAAFALNRSVELYAYLFEPEAFLVLFLILMLWAVGARVRHRDLLAGLALGLCLLTRPVLLPALLVAPVVLRVRDGAPAWRRSTLAFLSLPVLALVVLSLRNHSLGAGYSPVVMNPGWVFFEANNPLASGLTAVYPPLVAELRNELPDEPDAPHASYRLLARADAGARTSTPGANSYWRSKALNFIADFPLRWLALEARKVHAIWHAERRHDLQQAFGLDRLLQKASIPSVPLAMVSASSLLGLVLGRTRWREYLLYYALFAIQAASMLAFYVSDRQRLTLLPLFLVFACIGASEGLKFSGRTRVALLAGVLAIAASLSVPSDAMRDDAHLWDSDLRCNQLWRRAAAMQEEGNLLEAADAYALSFAAAPWGEDASRPDAVSYGAEGFAGRAVALWPRLGRRSASAKFDLGTLSLAAGRLGEAEGIFRDLLASGARFERGPLQSSLPQYYLGQAALRRGAAAEAQAWFERCLDVSPGEPFALAQLAALTGSRDPRDRLLRYYGPVETDWLMGRALLEQGKARDAQATLLRLVAGVPGFRRGRIYLAAAHGAAGEPARGAELFLAATADRPAPVMLEDRILPMFASLAEGNPVDPEARRRFALVSAQYGHFPGDGSRER